MSTNKSSVERQMGFWSIILFGVNGILGSGIFLLPGQGYNLFGPASILALCADAVLVLMIGMCFAECAGLFSETGGAYLYAKTAFGPFVGYEVGVVTWAIRIIAEGTLYVAIATAIGGVYKPLATTTAKNIIVTIIGIILILINLTGVKTSEVFNNVVTVAKLVPILLVAIVGLFFLHPANFHPFFLPGSTANGFANATITLFMVFTGIESLVITAGNMKDASKNLPRALLLVILIVATIYILVVVSCVGILGSGLAHSSVPLQDAAQAVAGRAGESIIVIGTFLSMGGLALNSSFISPRLAASLADNHQMPKKLGAENSKGAPYVAIIIHTCLAMAVAWSGSYTTLVAISVVSRFAQYIPTCLAVLVFRKTKKDQKRSFKIPGGWFIPVLAVVASVWLLTHATAKQLILGFGALLIILPFYFITGQNKRDTALKENSGK